MHTTIKPAKQFLFSIFRKMSTTLCIGYAHKSCSAEQVKKSFEEALEDGNIVSRVEFVEKTNDATGETFYVFFIHFNHSNTALQHMFSRIEHDSFCPLTYGTRFDRKTGKTVDTYWKITAYKPKPQDDFKPRILSVEEAQVAGIKAPKAVA